MDHLSTRQTAIAGVVLLTPKRFGDARGYFTETYNARSFAAVGLTAVFVQDNQALSATRGTLRGLHFQRPPHPQAKLVRVLTGCVFDVAVDLRVDSPTYGRWVGEVLTAEAGTQLFVPRGCAHGYCTLEPDTEVAYKVDGFYAPECDDGIAWDDPTLAIAWPIGPGEVALSDKDQRLGRFVDFVSPFRMDEPSNPRADPVSRGGSTILSGSNP